MAFDFMKDMVGNGQTPPENPTGQVAPPVTAAVPPANTMPQGEQDLMATIKSILDRSVKDADTMWPIILAQSGYKLDADGKAVQMSEDERLAAMSPLDKQNYERQKTLAEREQLALEGKLELPVGTQQMMEEQKRQQESLLAQKLGPDWQLSTPGIQTRAKREASNLAATDAFRRGEVSLGMGLLGQNQALMQGGSQGLSNLLAGYGGRNLGAVQGYQGQLMPYENQQNRAAQIEAARYGARSAERAGMYGLLGTLGAAGIGAAFCWVAREVYGADNPKWLMFREWLVNKAPKWFYELYMNHGEKFAKFIHNKPTLKWIIRMWMDSRISEVNYALSV